MNNAAERIEKAAADAHKAIERAERIKMRLSRAIKRVLQMPTHRMALSADSIELVHADLRRIVRHAVKIGWLAADPTEGEKDGPSSDA